MDVTCPRCQTDYEFDDALVSERGTTVKCTNCGHQFRVFRSGASPSMAPEVWRIERADADTLELRSLVELQRAIRAGRISRQDLLKRGDSPPRHVGDIPELEPFFPAPTLQTPTHTQPLPSASVHEALTPPQERIQTPAYTSAVAPAGDLPRISATTLRPAVSGAAPPPRTSRGDGPILTPRGIAAYTGSEPPGLRRGGPLPPPRTPVPMAPADLTPIGDTSERVSLDELVSQLDRKPSQGRELDPELRRSLAAASRPPGPSVSRDELYDSMFPPEQPPKRGGASALVAVVVIVGALVVVGATVGRPWIERVARLVGGAPGSGPAVAGPVASADAGRLERELSLGDRARNDGDFTAAREAYSRATGIDDRSLAAWDGLCSAETELAVVHWVAALMTASPLEREQAATTGATAGKACQRWGELARATDEGAKRAGSDLRAAHALAAQGDGAGARLYVGAHPGDPMLAAIVLLADASKKGAPAVAAAARAASAELAKVEASQLATPGDLALAAFVATFGPSPPRAQEAITELARRAPRHLLLESLRQLATTGDAGVHDAGARTDNLARAVDPLHPPRPGDLPGPVEVPAGDYRSLDEKGQKALASGDSTRAETMFRAALAQHPGDVDALFGLGQISRARGDHAGAIGHFSKVLEQSGGFAPARLALADEQWATGQRAEAAKNYELYLERVGEGSGADRARARVGGAKPEPKVEPTASASASAGGESP